MSFPAHVTASLLPSSQICQERCSASQSTRKTTDELRAGEYRCCVLLSPVCAVTWELFSSVEAT